MLKLSLNLKNHKLTIILIISILILNLLLCFVDGRERHAVFLVVKERLINTMTTVSGLCPSFCFVEHLHSKSQLFN